MSESIKTAIRRSGISQSPRRRCRRRRPAKASMRWRDPGDIERHGDLALEIAADRRVQLRTRRLRAQKGAHQHQIRRGAGEQVDAVKGHRGGGELGFRRPGRGEGQQRQTEQQDEIGPEHRAVDRFDHIEQVVVVVPVDRHVGEADDIGEESRPKLRQRRKILAMGRLQLQNHDGDDDGDHAIRKRLQPFARHAALLFKPPKPRAPA